MLVHAYLFTPLPFFYLQPETGWWGRWWCRLSAAKRSNCRLDAEQGMAGLKCRIGVTQLEALQNASASEEGSVSVSSPGRLWRVFLELIDHSFFFARETCTHRHYVHTRTC